MRAIFYYLVKTPKVYAKLRKEIDDADKEGKLSELVSFEESQNMKYL